jgi:cytoskeletal protein RodZ
MFTRHQASNAGAARARTQFGERPLSRSRLIALLIWIAVLVCALVWGLVLAVVHTVHPHASADRQRPGSSSSGPAQPGPDPASADQGARDALAHAPMPDNGDPDAAEPAELTTRTPSLLALPASTHVGAAGVRTGLPHTPEGAVAQLAAIDQTAMESASLTGVRSVIAAWARAGGPTTTTWSSVKAMAEFLSSAGAPAGGLPQLSLTFTPSMGLIKGRVGDDFVVACVDYVAVASFHTTNTAAVADCQRMAWTGDRWQIDAGPEPAVPQSIWPDTEAAIAAGWKDLAGA